MDCKGIGASAPRQLMRNRTMSSRVRQQNLSQPSIEVEDLGHVSLRKKNGNLVSGSTSRTREGSRATTSPAGVAMAAATSSELSNPTTLAAAPAPAARSRQTATAASGEDGIAAESGAEAGTPERGGLPAVRSAAEARRKTMWAIGSAYVATLRFLV
uniref:Uncharacterized protein n=1 Tax=Leersia perrieri TaxID=77586 RepID=A0A0D9XA28_9ORYZ